MIKIIGIAAGVAVAGVAGLAAMNPGNVAETSESPQEEAFKTRHYKTDLKTLTVEAERIIPTLTKYGQHWRFISTSSDEKTATIKAEIPVVVFTDDLEIKAETHAEKDGTIVNVRSNSRVGKSDLGENRRHVLQLLRALDEKFK